MIVFLQVLNFLSMKCQMFCACKRRRRLRTSYQRRSSFRNILIATGSQLRRTVTLVSVSVVCLLTVTIRTSLPGMMSRTKPLSVKFGFGSKAGRQLHDKEGRLITAEFDSFYLLAVYVPSAGRRLVTMDKRMDWDYMFR